MDALFNTVWFDASNTNPAAILARLIAAVVFGAAIAWVYRRTTANAEPGSSFPATLVLLAVLIAMVTQVVGDNVARAFSLVGALSIVRFRTVVRDTRDTAFVIFAVVAGMAVGANSSWIAILGTIVGGCTAFVLARGSGFSQPHAAVFEARVRIAPQADPQTLLDPVMAPRTRSRALVSAGTARQGTAIEVTYRFELLPGHTGEELVRDIGLLEGVQDVHLSRRKTDQD